MGSDSRDFAAQGRATNSLIPDPYPRPSVDTESNSAKTPVHPEVAGRWRIRLFSIHSFTSNRSGLPFTIRFFWDLCPCQTSAPIQFQTTRHPPKSPSPPPIPLLLYP